ncbi:MAG: outer membrane protein assembly factor BamA [Candidatus Omnitrophica bacterium]|nr:Outer membrane protein assembly factor BamA [bacterium]NUN98412.1 outer membrane protein assembly factor BamA [Candidatus Omnitrophota bacterium]
MIKSLPWILSFVLLGDASAQIIGEIQVEGVRVSDRADVLKVIRTPVGASLRSAATQRSISDDLRRISELERFDPLSLKVEQRGSETLKTLVFIVREHPVVTDIEYTGNTKYKEKRLNTELGFEEGQNLFLRPGLIDKLEQKLETFYNTKGFSNVVVEGREGQVSDASATLVFAIEEGRKLKLQAVGFEGNVHFTDEELAEQVKTKPKFLKVFRKKFDVDQFKKDQEALSLHYQRHGFLEAKIAEGSRKLVADDKRLDVNFQIEEGPQYKLGKIVIEGATTFSRSDLVYPITVQPGDVLNRPQLIGDLQEVRSLYWNQGYRRVDIEPEIIPDRETGIADLHLRVAEGPRMRLRNIRIQGVAAAADQSVFEVPLETRDYVIEREFELKKGEVLDWSKVEETERKLVNLQYFETEENVFPPRLKHGFQLDPIPGTPEADLLLQLEETNTGFIQLGGGFSSDFGASLNFEFKDRNALGRGWSYSIGADVGSKRSSVNFSFYNPHLNNTDYSNRYSLYYRNTERVGGREFGEERIGGTVGFGKRLTKELNAEVVYRLERVELEDLDEDLILHDPDDRNATLVDQLYSEDSTITSSLAFNLVRDTRDFVLFPTKGVRDAVQIEGAGIGGDNKFVGLTGTADRYLKLREKLVFAARGHYSVAFPFGDTERIPLHERYFLGGSNTVRGFRVGGISPVKIAQRRVNDIDGNEIFVDDEIRVGGESQWYSNLELRYRWNDTVQSVGFLDAGNVFEEAGDLDLAETRVAVGSGLRLNLFSNALVRLDLGFPVAKEDEDKKQSFQFNFGANF